MSRQNLVSEVLQNIKAGGKQPFDNLYQHLSELLTRVPISDGKINNFEQLERISEFIKKTHFRMRQPKYEAQLELESKQAIVYPEWINRESQVIELASKSSTMDSRIVYNFQQTQNILKEIGISFGEEEGFKINCMLKQLVQLIYIQAKRFNATNLRYWGKIFTTFGDYTVVQGVCIKQNPPVVEGDVQKYREGVNYYSYWVSHESISEGFLELPIITPQQLVASRKIKHIFTGNPNADVLSYPKFPGKQKHLLKAQIVRITHNCEIAPKGLYTNLEENPDQIEFAEEFKLPDFAQLNNLQNWVHINPYILNMGRATYYVDPKLPEQQKQEMMGKLTEGDPKVDRLKGINEDKPVEKMGFEGCWIARVYGNTQLFNNVGKEEGTTSCYGAISLRNPNWPGWTTVCNSKNYGSIYIGYGLKSTQAPYSPIGPEDLLVEGEDNDEFYEPNPRDPPDELEPDSDDQNKKPDE